MKEAYSGYTEILEDSDFWAKSKDVAPVFTYYDNDQHTTGLLGVKTSAEVAAYIKDLYIGRHEGKPMGIQQGAALTIELETVPEATRMGYTYHGGIWKQDATL